MAVAGNNAYPSIETVLNLVRSLMLDDMAGASATVGEGQVYVDSMTISVTLSNFFNSALRELVRDLRISGGPMLVRDNVVVEGLTPVNSVQGLAAPNPAVQASLGVAGYFDGSTVNANLLLPLDLLEPITVWERLNGANARFCEMRRAVGALSSCFQGSSLGEYEWRGDAIWLRGATTVRDLRLRYWAKLVDLYTAGVDVTQTFIPIVDCEEALADKVVVRLARRISPDRLSDSISAAAASLFALRQIRVKAMQGVEYETQAYGSEAGPRLGF